MFSFFLGFQGYKPSSMAWFGGYSTDFIRKNFEGYSQLQNQEIHDLVTYLPITSSYYWQTSLNGLAVREPGKASKESALRIKSVIFDTGSSMNYLPKKDWKSLMRLIIQGRKCFKKAGQGKHSMIACECNPRTVNRDFPTIEMDINGYIFKFEPRFYLMAQ